MLSWDKNHNEELSGLKNCNFDYGASLEERFGDGAVIEHK